MSCWQVINTKPVMKTKQQAESSRATAYYYNAEEQSWMKLFSGWRHGHRFSCWFQIETKDAPESVRMAEMLRSE